MDAFLMPGDSALGAPAPENEIELLIQAIMNEKNAPEILHFRTDLVERLQAALDTQEEYVEQLESDMSQELRRMVLNLENKRVRFLLKQYHRVRLKKIEKFAASIMRATRDGDEQISSKLSKEELSYCEEYFKLLGRHFKSVVLDQLPPDFRSLVKLSDLSNHDDLILEPNLDTHVFAKAVDDCGAVQLNEDMVVDMRQDDLLIMRYQPVGHLVRTGQVVLI